MANKFDKKTWINRQTEHPTWRKLNSTGIENVYDIERYEGTVTEVGNAYDADNMNDFETRVYDALSKLDGTDVKILDSAGHFTAESLEGVLDELFTYAGNGKTAISSAIGGTASSSNTFQQLANLITSLKNNYDSQITSLKNSYDAEIANGKSSIASAIGATKSGTPSPSESFASLAGRISNDKKSYYIGNITVNAGSIGANQEINQNFSVNMGFTPSNIFLCDPAVTYQFLNSPTEISSIFTFRNKPIEPGAGFACGLTNLSASGFSLSIKTGSGIDHMSIAAGTITFIAIS